MRLLAAIAALLFACPVFGQVTARTGTNLQSAVDLVPDGGYVFIEGGTYEHIQIIDKSVILFGLAPWSITVSGDPMFNRMSLFGYTQPSPIEATGNASHWIYVGNARLGIDGRVGAGYAIPADGIRARGLGLVYVIDTIASGAICSEIENCEGGSGVDLEGVRTLVLERSYVTAGRSTSLHTSVPLNGSPGVRAHGATTILIFAWLQGGTGAPIPVYYSPSFDPCPCSWLIGGHGGNAIETGLLSNVWAILEPGAGGPVSWYEPSTGIYHPRGNQPPGLPFVQR